jgi:hypothetical protein
MTSRSRYCTNTTLATYVTALGHGALSGPVARGVGRCSSAVGRLTCGPGMSRSVGPSLSAGISYALLAPEAELIREKRFRTCRAPVTSLGQAGMNVCGVAGRDERSGRVRILHEKI